MTLLERLRYEANRKSSLDRDKELLTAAAGALEEMAAEITRLILENRELRKGRRLPVWEWPITV